MDSWKLASAGAWLSSKSSKAEQRWVTPGNILLGCGLGHEWDHGAFAPEMRP